MFLAQAINTTGCRIRLADLRCEPCVDGEGQRKVSGGFAPGNGIILCQDSIVSQQHMNHTVAHEMVHAFDHCRAKVDWTDCRHHACSEIRAATLSGDCSWFMEFMRGHFTLRAQHQACAKRRATLSVAMNPNCAEVAEDAVADAWEACSKDYAPFDDIP